MKIYIRPIYDVEDIYFLGDDILLEDNERLEIKEQEVVIEVDLKTDGTGCLVEHPVAICSKFELVVAKYKPVLVYSGDYMTDNEYDLIEVDEYVYSNNEVVVNQEGIEDFKSIIDYAPIMGRVNGIITL